MLTEDEAIVGILKDLITKIEKPIHPTIDLMKSTEDTIEKLKTWRKVKRMSTGC